MEAVLLGRLVQLPLGTHCFVEQLELGEGDAEENFVSLEEEAVHHAEHGGLVQVLEDPPGPVLQQLLALLRSILRLQERDTAFLK